MTVLEWLDSDIGNGSKVIKVLCQLIRTNGGTNEITKIGPKGLGLEQALMLATLNGILTGFKIANSNEYLEEAVKMKINEEMRSNDIKIYSEEELRKFNVR